MSKSHTLEFDTVGIDSALISADGAEEIIRSLGALDEEQKLIVRRTVTRLTQLSLLAIGNTPDAQANLLTERNALLATLASLGEEKAQMAGAKAEQFVWQLISRGLDVALGKII